MEYGKYRVAFKDFSLLEKAETTNRKPGYDKVTIECADNYVVEHKFYCQTCGETPHRVYIVMDELWEETGLDGYICHECFEKELGRKLTLEDLKDVHCNDWLKWNIVKDNY